MLSDARLDYSATACWLFEAYGAILDSSATAKSLGFKNVSALHQARRSGRLPIVMFKIDGRRGWFSRVKEVGAWIDNGAGSSARRVGAHI
jgi:hypothetical protein